MPEEPSARCAVDSFTRGYAAVEGGSGSAYALLAVQHSVAELQILQNNAVVTLTSQGLLSSTPKHSLSLGRLR